MEGALVITQRLCLCFVLTLALGLPVVEWREAAEAKGVIEKPQPTQQRLGTEHEGMAWIRSGTFWMGCEDKSFEDVRPVHQVHINGFWIDRMEVTNEEFARFVRATGYKTVAERK